MKKNVFGIIGFLFLVLFDQFTKYLAVKLLMGNKGFPLISGIFEFQYLENRGAAFGMMQNQRGFLLVVTLVILAAIIFFYLKLPGDRHYFLMHLVAVMIAAGAVGNMIDRLRNGYVIDFLYFKLIDFPIFNVADCYVVTAAILAMFLVLFFYKDEDFRFLKKSSEE